MAVGDHLLSNLRKCFMNGTSVCLRTTVRRRFFLVAILKVDLPTLRARLHADHKQPAIRRMDRNIWIRTPDRRTARPPDPPRQHPRDERRKLPPWPEQGASGNTQNLNLNPHRLALTGQSIRATASYMTSAAARMLALVWTLIITAPKWQHFALPFGPILLCR